MRITESRLRSVIRQVLEEENFISRVGSALKRGVKSAVYGDHDVLLDDLTKKSGVETDGQNNYLVPLDLANKVGLSVNEDEIFYEDSGDKFIIIYNDNKTLGVRALLSRDSGRNIPELFSGIK